MPKHDGDSLKSSDRRSKPFNSNYSECEIFLLIVGFMRSSAEITQHLSPRFLHSIGKVHLS